VAQKSIWYSLLIYRSQKHTWGRRQYGTVYGSVGHKKYVGQKTIWYSLWICRSQIIRCTEDNIVQFMDLSVTNNTWHRRQYGTVGGSVGHKKKCGAEDNMVQFMDLSVTNNTWDRRQYGTVDGSVGHKKKLGSILSSAPRFFL
jgi:hypothetical protein